MTECSAFAQRFGQHFGLPNAPALVTRGPHDAEFAVIQLKCDKPNQGLTTPIPPEDSFIVALQLRDRPDYELWLDGRPVHTQPLRAGTSAFFDLRRNPITLMISPFHTLAFYLPRKALDVIADDADANRIGDLDYQPGTGVDDQLIRNLGSCMLGAFEQPAQANRLFVDHVTLAAASHVAQTYGGMKVRPLSARGGLAPWQERRAKEFIDANLHSDITMALLARTCGLSRTHFSHAFRQTTRTSPHQWLMQRRVERAKQMLRDSEALLADVALACGFADQSHFTRVFAQSAGISPGQWRRVHHS
jgi:AraC family transcriptional regulator